MVDAAARPDIGLPELLAERARAASARRLGLDLGLGGAVALAAVVWRPTAWQTLLCAALCFAAYGAWGMADRRLRAGRDADPLALALHGPRADLPVWRAVRGASALVGTLAAAGLVLSTMFGILGRWIS
jgi:hypothetical protein